MANPSTSKWSSAELRYALRQKSTIRTIYPGMEGVLIEIREKDVVLKLSHGATAYLSLDSLAAPPTRFAVGARVSTPYGNGVIESIRATDDHIDYAVKLVNWSLSGGQNPIAYLGVDNVTARVASTFDEILYDSNLFRLHGNELFKEGRFMDASNEYSRCVNVFSLLSSDLTLEQRILVRDGIVKALSNNAQCMLSLPEPDYKSAIHFCSEALEIDPNNGVGQREKLLHRRGVALLKIGAYDLAVKDLSQLADQVSLSKLKEAKEGRKRQSEEEKALWTAAFSKAQNGDYDDPTEKKDSKEVESPNMPALRPVQSAASSESITSQVTSKPVTVDAAAISRDFKQEDLRNSDDSEVISTSGMDETMEEEVVEETSGWKKYLAFGAAAVGALALTALVVSKTRAK